MAKVVLVNAPIQFSSQDGDEMSYYPLNLLYLAAALEKAGHEVTVIDPTANNMPLEVVLITISEINPLTVGISSMTVGIRSAVRLAKAIRKRFNGNIPIGLGGVHITVDKDFCRRNPYFDYWVIGEAEVTYPKIITHLEKHKGRKIQQEWHGHTVADLDELPFPARHLINPAIYKRKEQMDYEKPAAGILASRGCPFNCVFCSIPNHGRKVRLRSAENIVDEMESIYESCGGRYSFVDDCFTVNGRWAAEVCQAIIDRKISCHWIASTRADAVNKNLITLMRRAGCAELYFGVESGNDHIRNKLIGKNLSLESVKQAVELCKKNNILSNLFLMVGFPQETEANLEDTINVGLKVKPDVIGVHITRPFPGSRLWKIGGYDEGTIDTYANDATDRSFRSLYPYYVPEGLSLDMLVAAKKKAYRTFYLHPATIARRIRYWLKVPSRFKDDVKLFKLAPYILINGGSKGQLS